MFIITYSAYLNEKLIEPNKISFHRFGLNIWYLGIQKLPCYSPKTILFRLQSACDMEQIKYSLFAGIRSSLFLSLCFLFLLLLLLFLQFDLEGFSYLGNASNILVWEQFVKAFALRYLYTTDTNECTIPTKCIAYRLLMGRK